MPTGYSSNKDNRGVELEREKRAKEAQERIRKQHLASDLNAKKSFLFSTKTTIEMKESVMKARELRIRVLEGEIKALDAKEKIVEQKVQTDEAVRQSLAGEEKQKKVELDSVVVTRRTHLAEGMQIDRALTTLHAEIEKETREIEAEKMKLANLQKNEADLKKKKDSLHLSDQDGTFTKKTEIDTLHRSAEKKGEEERRFAADAERLKRQKELKSHDLIVTEKERATLKREIDQLTKDRAKLEVEVKKLEMESR